MNVLKIKNDVSVVQFSVDDDKFNKMFERVLNGDQNLKIYCLGTPNVNIYKGRKYNQFIAEKTAIV